LGECLLWLQAIDENDRAEIRRVLAEIIRGQSLDLQRFGGEHEKVRALQTGSELEEYTYLVAGCVGDFWTRICLLHLENFTTISAEELLKMGTDFGKGLQLVNILRDLPEDLRNGRCYLPAEELAEVGVSPQELAVRAEAVRPVVNRWLARADELLDGGRLYVRAIRPSRVRIACFLPWYIGRETVELLRATPPLETLTRIKVPRRTIRTALFLGMVAAVSNYPVRDRRRTSPITSEESSSAASR
jgi:farnesyl-diphosphate farnesyltransferase